MQMNALVQTSLTGAGTGVAAQPAPAPAAALTTATSPVQPAGPPFPAALPSREEVEHAAGHIREVLKSSSVALEFSIEEQSDRIMIRIVDQQTGQMIRQIPSEELLAIARALDRMEGLLVSEKA